MRPSVVAVAIAPVLALGVASAAHADRGGYRALSFTETANPGLTVSGSLGDTYVAVSRARVIVPTEWRRLKAKAGELRFISPGGSCRYRVTFTVRSRLGEPRDAADYVAEGLPAAGPAYVLDSGQRAGNRAFRVIREKSTGRVVRVRGLRAAVLTRRADVAPSGQTAWSEIAVDAASLPGDECHSGTWRERLGPQLGDALATARTNLTFAKKSR
jgi:hypothetical protein